MSYVGYNHRSSLHGWWLLMELHGAPGGLEWGSLEHIKTH